MAAASAANGSGSPCSGVRLRHILLWDPDAITATKVAGALRTRGHEVHAIGGGDDVAACLAQDQPDMMVVGLADPCDPGRAKRLRTEFTGPLVCYARAASARERIELLACGIDDVAPSPLSYEELALRVQAVARRASVTGTDENGMLRCGAVEADSGRYQVRLRGRWIQLTAIEFSLLGFLMRNPRVAFSRRDLLRQVWGYEIGDMSTVSVHVRRLRCKLEIDATQPEMIRTVWGSGYYFNPDAA